MGSRLGPSVRAYFGRRGRGQADAAAGRREVSREADEAPRLPVAGTSVVSSFNEKVYVDLLFLDDVIALSDVGPVSKYLHVASVQLENPLEAREALSAPRISVFCRPRSMQMDSDGG